MCNLERYLGIYSARFIQGFSTRTAARDAAFFLPHLQAGIRLLDCGCGPGTMTVDLAQVIAPGQVVGIDIAAEQFQVGQARARDRGLTTIHFTASNVYALPFPDETFDAVFAHAVLYHLRDPDRALKEMYRVLKPRGVVGVRDADRDGDVYAPADAQFEQAWSLLYKVHSLHGGNAYLGKTLRAVLHEAGFEDVQASASYDHYGTPEAVKKIGDQLSELILQPSIVNSAIARGWADRSEIEAISTALKVWSEHPGAFLARCRCEAVGWKA